jgi:hypothetical protein
VLQEKHKKNRNNHAFVIGREENFLEVGPKEKFTIGNAYKVDHRKKNLIFLNLIGQTLQKKFQRNEISKFL